MIDRTHDPRKDEAALIAAELRRRAEDRDGWRRFWAGLTPADRKLLKDVIEAATA